MFFVFPVTSQAQLRNNTIAMSRRAFAATYAVNNPSHLAQRLISQSTCTPAPTTPPKPPLKSAPIQPRTSPAESTVTKLTPTNPSTGRSWHSPFPRSRLDQTLNQRFLPPLSRPVPRLAPKPSPPCLSTKDRSRQAPTSCFLPPLRSLKPPGKDSCSFHAWTRTRSPIRSPLRLSCECASFLTPAVLRSHVRAQPPCSRYVSDNKKTRFCFSLLSSVPFLPWRVAANWSSPCSIFPSSSGYSS